MKTNRAKELSKIMAENPIDSEKYMDAWDEARQLAYDCTFGIPTNPLNPEAMEECVKALERVLANWSAHPDGLGEIKKQIQSALQNAIIK